MLRRFLERRSPFAPDKSHFHHRLLELGFTQRRAVLIIYGVTLCAVGLGLLTMGSENAGSLVVFALALLFIVLLFQLVGAVRLGQTVSRLQEKYKLTCQERAEETAFEQLQLWFRQACGADRRWEAICEAAERMDFAWIALNTTPRGWPRRRRTLASAGRQAGPLANLHHDNPAQQRSRSGISQQLEVAICVNGSLEDAGRRATLFTRLIDERMVWSPKAPLLR